MLEIAIGIAGVMAGLLIAILSNRQFKDQRIQLIEDYWSNDLKQISYKLRVIESKLGLSTLNGDN